MGTSWGRITETILFLAFCAMLAQVLPTILGLGSKRLSLRIRTIFLRGYNIGFFSLSILLGYPWMHRNSVCSLIHSFTHVTTIYREQLCAGHCSRCWGNSNEMERQGLCPGNRWDWKEYARLEFVLWILPEKQQKAIPRFWSGKKYDQIIF